MSVGFEYEVPGVVCYTCANAIESVLNTYNKNQDDKAHKSRRKLGSRDQATNGVDHPIRFTIDQTKTNPFNAIIAIRADGDINDPDDVSRQIKTILSDAGFDDSIEKNRSAGDDVIYQNKKRKLIRSYLLKGVFGTVSGLLLMILCVSGISIPFISMSGLAVMSSLATLAIGAQTYYDTAKLFFKSKALTMDSLFAISTLTTVGVSLASIFIPGLPMMLEAGLLTFGFRYLGKAIEEKIKNKMNATLSFRDRAPKYVEKYINSNSQNTLDANWLSKQAEWQGVLVSDIKVNDIIRIKRGSIIPVDGQCVNQKSLLINDRMIRGSTYDRVIQTHDALLAGMQVPYDGDDDLIMRVTRCEADSHLARSDRAVASANAKKAPIENVTNKILKYFVPGVLTLSAISGALVSIFFSPALAIQCATSLLVSACPCTLGFITPLALKVGMAKAMENGIQFKNGKALQNAEQIDTVVFDLNGTLTIGQLEVSDVVCFSQEKKAQDEFFNCLYHIEKQSQHPIAKLLEGYIDKNKRQHLSPLTINENDIHRDHAGLSVKINDDEYLVGNENFLKQHQIHLSREQKIKFSDSAQRKVYLVKNNQVMGYVTVNDPLRPEAKWVVNQLKRMGKDVHICTGADMQTAKAYAKQLGIPLANIQANCVDATTNANPNSKLAYIEKLQKSGKRVAMIGDAGNDAVALKKSNFGIAIRSTFGDEITERKAGAIVDINEANDSRPLLSVLSAFAIAKETVSSIKQNLVMSLIYNTSMMLVAGGALLTLGVVLNPGVCVGVMFLQTSCILLNEYRIRQRDISYVQRFNANDNVFAAGIKSQPHKCSTRKMLNQLEADKGEYARDTLTQKNSLHSRQIKKSNCQLITNKFKNQIYNCVAWFQHRNVKVPLMMGAPKTHAQNRFS